MDGLTTFEMFEVGRFTDVVRKLIAQTRRLAF